MSVCCESSPERVEQFAAVLIGQRNAPHRHWTLATLQPPRSSMNPQFWSAGLVRSTKTPGQARDRAHSESPKFGSVTQSEPHTVVVARPSGVLPASACGVGVPPVDEMLPPLSQSFVQSVLTPGGCEPLSVLEHATAATQSKPTRHAAYRDMTEV